LLSKWLRFNRAKLGTINDSSLRRQPDFSIDCCGHLTQLKTSGPYPRQGDEHKHRARETIPAAQFLHFFTQNKTASEDAVVFNAKRTKLRRRYVR
jgi:hypothetical protein